MASKKSQAENQVFIFLLTAVIIGLLFFFGIKWLGTLISTNDQISVVQLRVDMENSFDRARPNYMSSYHEEFSVPDGIDKICFVDQEWILKEGNFKKKTGLCDKTVNNGADFNPIMCDAWDGSVAENVFFEPSIETPVYVNKIKIADPSGYVCFVVQAGKIKLKLVGLGDSVKISSDSD